MGEQTNPDKPMKHICAGLLAHVDAGKTTLAESLLYLRGSVRKLGRVDHRDAFLDTYELERSRGITIFSKQAQFLMGDRTVTLLDTPGHVDFSAEMERTLQVLDYAILVISGADGVQGHVMTLWKLLKVYKVPVFLFINKMDQEGTDREALLKELQTRLDERCIDFSSGQEEEFLENLAVCEERILEEYLEKGTIEREEITRMIGQRKVFPCYFGSALKLQGVEEFLQGLETYTKPPVYPTEFGARVYKIARDDKGARLTYMKITGGSLKVKTLLTNRGEGKEKGSGIWEEKVDQIRIYSGAQFETEQEAEAGTICAVTGLEKTCCGEGLGIETDFHLPVLEPVLTYKVQLPQGCDTSQMFLKLRQLEEEEPQLHIVWDKASNEIHAQVMGEVQIEILKSMIQKRYGVAVKFGSGTIVYKETIAEPVEGVGHFEPLRHYAEAHLLLEPGERGSGLVFSSACSEDMLDRNWQRLILTHLEEKKHPGVLTGSEITDMKITLIAGKAHLKHTEGGDFRQATYRAVRQGLKKAKSVLLEPVYEFRLEVPSQMVGRAMADIQKMHGEFQPPETEGETAVLTGTAPVASMQGYQTEVISYTKGHGRIFCSLKGYEVCHNSEEVIEAIGYDSERDLENPTGSVFCSHGAGINIRWDQVSEYMHVESGWKPKEEHKEIKTSGTTAASASFGGWQDEKELEEIFNRTYGQKDRNQYLFSSRQETGKVEKRFKKQEYDQEYLLVDGYNIIFAWEELKELAKINVESARDKLMDILSNYQGFRKNTVILVFDAYKVAGNKGEVMKYHNIYVVYTKEAETADQYIEKTVHEMGKRCKVTVATSDALEQLIIMGQGAERMSARGLYEEIALVNQELRSSYLNRQKKGNLRLFHDLPEDLAEYMEEVRIGKKEI